MPTKGGGFILALLAAGTISKMIAKHMATMDTAGKKIAEVSKMPERKNSTKIVAVAVCVINRQR